jgi:hypothetical protein
MFSILTNLTKAAIAVAVTPVLCHKTILATQGKFNKHFSQAPSNVHITLLVNELRQCVNMYSDLMASWS